MNKTTKFIVEVVTHDEIVTQEMKNEMAQNIADAIIEKAESSGITPEDSETFTEIVYVKEWYSDKQIIEHIH